MSLIWRLCSNEILCTPLSYLMANHTRVKDRLTSAQVTDYPFTCPIVRGEILFGIELLPIGRRRQSLENQANNLFFWIDM